MTSSGDQQPSGSEATADRGGSSRGGPRATMRDVAAEAGVSLKTVSRVVNGEAGVSARLVARVESASDRLDYRPHLGARNLRRGDGRTATIGVVLENLANPFSGLVHRAIEDVARARDVAVLAGSVDETATRERELVTAFAARRVDGLIVMPTGPDQGYLARELSAGTALVFVDRAPRSLEGDAVVSDNRAGARACVEHLIAHGHRDIAFLGDRSTVSTATERHSGFAEAMRAAGLPVRPELVAYDLDGMDVAEHAALALLDLDRPPTALFTAQNLISMGALRGLRARGVQHRVAMVGFDDFVLADLLDPPITVAAQDSYDIGRRAAEQLFARLDGDTSPPRRQVVPTRLIMRGSGEIPPPG